MLQCLLQERRTFRLYLKLESLPLYDFARILETGIYKDKLADIIDFALKDNMNNIFERIICYYPESINEQIVQNADEYLI